MSSEPYTAVLGFRPHTYWTAVVALAGRPNAPSVIARRRLTFAAGEERSVFHRVEKVGLDEAEQLVIQVQAATQTNAAREISALLADLRRDEVMVRTAVVPTGGAKVPESLADILRSHTRMHAAEGGFYRGVVASACEVAGLAVHRVVERELPALVCGLLGVAAPALEARLKDMGRALGPPWTEDYKLATEAAWLHLEGAQASAGP